MTPAEFDTRRRLLGLSIQETADYLGVQRRTVERWISGYSNVTPDALTRLEALERDMNEAVNQALSLARERGADDMVLYRYRSQEAVDASRHAAGMPLGAHAMMIGWASEALENDGHSVTVDWGDA